MVSVLCSSSDDPLYLYKAVSEGTLFIVNTVELQWLESLGNHENMFETWVVRANEYLSKRQIRRHNRDIFSIFFNMKVCCVFSLESPH